MLVRVAAAGVCHSDVRLADGELGEGRWPMVLGHEGAGVVEAVGEGVTHVAPGDPVGFCFVPSCGECRACRAGHFTTVRAGGRERPRRDADRRDVAALARRRHAPARPDDRVLRRATVVAANGAVPLPSKLPLWQAALLGCGVVTGFGAVRNVARVLPGETVCVIGCGGVGLQVIAAAKLAGADPIVAVDRDPAKHALALRRGATHAVEPSAEAIRAIVDGFDHAIEVVGRPETMRLAWDVLRAGGTAVVVGLVPQGVEVALPAIEFLSDKGIRGSYYGSGDPAADLVALAQLDLHLDEVVSNVTDLDGVNDALDRLRRGEGARTIVVLDAALAGAPQRR